MTDVGFVLHKLQRLKAQSHVGRFSNRPYF